jgi:3-hydroxyisobutyrate dehydrogenase-like beta-hydroxyacid dehydrogenase
MNEEIGFIGLGHLGLPMAENLVQAGYRLAVFNRTAAKAGPLVAQGVRLAARPADAVTSGGIVVTVLWDDASMEEVVMSDAFLDRLGNGVHVSMTTISPAMARKLAAVHAEYGSAYVAATVFGLSEAAVARELWIPMAGPQAAKDRVRPLLGAMGGQGIFDFGEDAGAADVVKLVGNFLIASAGYAVREGLAMAKDNGVDPRAVIDMLTQTLFPAPIYRSYGRRIAEQGELVFHQVAIPRKDVGLFREAARQTDLRTPVADMVQTLLLADDGGQRQDGQADPLA